MQDSIENYIKEYPNQEQVKMMKTWLADHEPGKPQWIATVYSGPNGERTKTDARLIAAAPKMLEALEARVAHEERNPPPFGHGCQWCGICYERLQEMEKEAIAAARGETP